MLAEFGDDQDCYASAKARENCAATSPITVASGKKKTVMPARRHPARLPQNRHPLHRDHRLASPPQQGRRLTPKLLGCLCSASRPCCLILSTRRG
nr:hypothetical protein [Actinoplanes sp. ATCC 53533]